MNIKEWHQAFKVQLDTLDTESALRLQPEVVDVFFNKAINKIMVELYNEYEESQEISDGMSSQIIIQSIPSTNITPTGFPNQWKVSIPSNYYHHLQSYATLKAGNVTGVVRTVKQLLDSENKVISNPFEKADDTEVPIFFKDRGIYVYTPDGYTLDSFNLTENDLEIRERDFKAQTSTVLMIDISHSMILYGEDRITPAKKVAMALAELIKTKYPKDTLDIIVFGNDAWPIEVKDLPYLQVGPYHTNTYAGLELAMDILRKRRNTNKQIFMITDGKPTCLKEGAGYYQNSFGLDRKIINKTLTMAAQARRLNIPITTFMIASDPYLQKFVREFTEVNNGKAYYSSLNGLGDYIFEDFEKNKRKKVK
jgi:hypothetical protein